MLSTSSVGQLSRPEKIELLGLLDEQSKRAARTDLVAYIQRTTPAYVVNWHHREMADALMALWHHDIDRLMLIEPPRHGKSMQVSQRFPAWSLGQDPTIDIIAASYGGELSSGFGRRLRNLMDGREHLSVFPHCQLAGDSKARDRWNTVAGGGYLAAGVGSGITGFGMHLGVIDDPHKSREEAESELMRDKVWDWYVNDLYTRRMPGCRIVLVMTRWHDDDLGGRLLNEESSGGDKWHVIHHPALNDDGEALWPGQFPVPELERIRRVIGPRAWQSLYQGNPTPEEGTYFLAEWFWEYDKRPENLRIYGASDYAVTQDGGDYTVHVVIGVDPTGIVYILDLWRKQTTSDVWADALIDLMEQWEPIIWAEEIGADREGSGTVPDKAHVGTEGAIAPAVSGPRQWTRPSGRDRFRQEWRWVVVWFAFRAVQRGTPNSRARCFKFPLGKNDDQVDALSPSSAGCWRGWPMLRCPSLPTKRGRSASWLTRDRSETADTSP